MRSETVTVRPELSRADLLRIVREECLETALSAELLEDRDARGWVRVAARLTWLSIVDRVQSAPRAPEEGA